MARLYGKKFTSRHRSKFGKATLDGETFKFKKGGFHQTTGTPEGKTIPKSKWRAALSGKYGKKGERQARTGLALMGKTEKEFLG